MMLSLRWIQIGPFIPKLSKLQSSMPDADLEPHKLNDETINAVLKHYTPNQVLEMTMSMCGNNAINRWKEGAGIHTIVRQHFCQTRSFQFSYHRIEPFRHFRNANLGYLCKSSVDCRSV